MTNEEAVAWLQQMLQVDTEAQNENKIADMILTLLHPEMDDHLITIRRLPFAPGRDTLVLSAGPKDAKKVLALDGHMDVADAGDESRWLFPPFSGHLDDGRIYGRGAADMKAGLAALVIAFKRAVRQHLSIQLRLFCTVGAENDHAGARQIKAAGLAEDLTALLVGEPTDSALAASERGVLNYTLTAEGKAANASQPELGANAIHGLLAFFQAAMDQTAPLLDRSDGLLGNATHSIDLIQGGNQINSLPETAQLSGNISTTVAANNAAFIAALQHAAQTQVPAGVNLMLSIQSKLDPAIGDPKSRLIDVIQAAHAKIKAQLLPVHVLTSGSDAGVLMQPQMDLAIYGPGSDTAHQSNEWVAATQYLQFIESYYQIIMNY